MEHSSEVYLSEPNMAPEAELTRLVQALTILPSEQREALLRIISTAPSFEALQAELAAHPDLKVAFEQCSMNTDESLKCKQNLDQLITPFVPASLYVSFQRAIETTVQYRWTNNEEALEEATASWEYIFHHPDFPSSGLEFRQIALNNGGIAFHLRYFARQQIEDLSRGLVLFQQALIQTPLDPKRRAVPLCNLGAGLLARYGLTGELADLEQGVQYLQEALSLIPLDSPNRSSCLINLGIGLTDLYFSKGQLADLEQGIRYLQEALDFIPLTSLNRPLCLTNLGNSLLTRYSHKGQLADLEQGIQYLQEALNLLTANTSIRINCLDLLGQGLLERYDHIGELADLEQALQLLREAVSLTSPNLSSQVGPLRSLSRSLIKYYRHTGELVNLEQAIQYLHQALSVIPSDSHRRVNLLNSLGSALSERYDLTKEVVDLEQAIQCFKEGLNLEAGSLHTRANLLVNLGTALHTRYTLTKERADLEQAIRMCQQVVDETPVSWPMRVIYLTALAIVLHARYELTRNQADLDQAISLYNQAFTVILPGSPNHTDYLTDLGNLWLSRYEHTGNLVDLKHALNTLQQAVEEIPFESSNRTLYLINWGEGLYISYRYTGEKEDLERTITIWNEAWFSLRSNFVTLPVSYKFGQQKRWFDLYTNLISAHLLVATIDRSIATASRQKALEVAESSKSILLTQLVGRSTLSNPLGTPPEIIDRERALVTELTALDNAELVTYGRMTIDQERIDGTRDLHRRQAYLQELEKLWAAISKMGQEGSDYVAMRRGDAPTWADLRRLANELGQNTALLSFFITVNRTRLFLLRKGWRGPRIVEIPLHESKWLDLLLRFSHEIPSSGGSNRRGETWDQPLQVLLKMASKHLVGVNRLILTPQGAGHLLPWSVVFQRTGYRTSEGLPLPLVTLPALGLLTRLRQRPRSLDGPTLVIGNPRGDLPFAEQEAQAVAAQFGVTPLIGSQATKSVVLAQLEQASLIHLATHAFFVPGAPLEAAIELANDELTAREVLQLRLQADLLVLSGCETGKAETLGGEELAGLAQAFLQAGVRSLLVSLWPVNDPATAALMQAFYNARQAGSDKALALRQAMTQIQQDLRWSHPYYWGAFVLIGDWD